MMRVVLAALVLAGAPPTASSLAGQAPVRSQPTVPRIAFIRSQEVLARTPGYAAAESTLTNEVQSFRAEIQKLQQRLDSAVRALDQQAIALSPAAKEAKQRELQGMQQQYQQRAGEMEERIQQRQRELFGPLNARVRAVIEGIRAEDNYSLILDVDAQNGGVVAADPALNITAKVIQRLQQAQ